MSKSPARRPSRLGAQQGKGWMSVVAGVVTVLVVLAVVTEFIDPEASEGAIRRAVLTVEDSLSGRKSGAQLLLQGSIGDDGADLAEAAEQVGSQPLKGDALPGGGASVATSAVSPYNNMPTPGDMTAKYPGACKQNPPPQVPDVKVERLWHSNKLRKLTDVTLVTQLSIDRLPALELQCSVWGGVISAAVYVPLVDDSIVSEDERLHGTGVPKAIAIVDTFHDKQETQGKCKLDMLLVTEDAVSLKYVGLYPVNALRNRALMMAKTDIILILDADFVPNLSLSEDLDNPQMYDQLHRATSARQLIILPAFQVLADGEEGRRLALKAIESKEDVVRMMQNARAQGFHMDGFVNGHRSTDFDRWQTAEIAYRVQYEEGFEPYVMAQRQFVPWYDERFKGYRKNKVVHLMHMNSLGMTFVTTPRAWVVHVPHQEAVTWKVTRETGYWKKLQRLYQIVVKETETDTFLPSTAFQCEGRHPPKWSWYRRRSAARRMLANWLQVE